MSFEAASPVVSAFKRLSELRRSKQRKELLSSGVVILHSRCRSLSLGFNTILSCAGNPQKSYPSKKENAEAVRLYLFICGYFLSYLVGTNRDNLIQLIGCRTKIFYIHAFLWLLVIFKLLSSSIQSPSKSA